jgi:hypothetical protein
MMVLLSLFAACGIMQQDPCPPPPHVYYHTSSGQWMPDELKGTEWEVVSFTSSIDLNLGENFRVWDLQVRYLSTLQDPETAIVVWQHKQLDGDDGSFYFPEDLEGIAEAGGLPLQ